MNDDLIYYVLENLPEDKNTITYLREYIRLIDPNVEFDIHKIYGDPNIIQVEGRNLIGVQCWYLYLNFKTGEKRPSVDKKMKYINMLNYLQLLNAKNMYDVKRWIPEGGKVLTKEKVYKDLKKFYKEDDSTSTMFNTRKKAETRQKEFNKQRKKYGFDERETWALDYTSVQWIYAHLKRFKKWTDCDLYYTPLNNYIVDVIKKDKDGNYIYHLEEEILKTKKEDEIKDWIQSEYKTKKVVFEYEKKQISCGEGIDLILEYLESYLIDEDIDFDKESLSYPLAREAFRIYGEILPSLWW